MPKINHHADDDVSVCFNSQASKQAKKNVLVTRSFNVTEYVYFLKKTRNGRC